MSSHHRATRLFGHIVAATCLLIAAPAWAVCGDGAIDGVEECDDGNADPDDGCTACVVDEGYLCTESFTLLGGWVQEDFNDPGDWQIPKDGSFVFQDDNSDPTVLLSPVLASSHAWHFTIESTDDDDDFFGFTLGMDDNDYDDATADYL